MSKTNNYGLTTANYARHLARVVCDTLGHGANHKASNLLLETACAETMLGRFPDSFGREGFGLTQFDSVGFWDVVKRTRKHDRMLVSGLGYDLDNCSPDDLTLDPLLALILTRLKYKLIPEQIPATLGERAHYWKRYYNTLAGKGTTDHYISAARTILYTQSEVIT